MAFFTKKTLPAIESHVKSEIVRKLVGSLGIMWNHVLIVKYHSGFVFPREAVSRHINPLLQPRGLRRSLHLVTGRSPLALGDVAAAIKI